MPFRSLDRDSIVDGLLHHSRAFVATGQQHYRRSAFAYAVLYHGADYAFSHEKRLQRLRDNATSNTPNTYCLLANPMPN